MTTQIRPLRTWHYLASPAKMEIAPCSCGNHDTQWSEFENHLWCAKCEIDFIPTHNGILDGPIPVQASAMMGLRFDRFNMSTQQVEVFNLESLVYEPKAA